VGEPKIERGDTELDHYTWAVGNRRRGKGQFPLCLLYPRVKKARNERGLGGDLGDALGKGEKRKKRITTYSSPPGKGPKRRGKGEPTRPLRSGEEKGGLPAKAVLGKENGRKGQILPPAQKKKEKGRKGTEKGCSNDP